MLVNKGITKEISDEFFIWLLIVRCVASSLFKSCILSLFTKKRVKFVKPKANLIFNAIPSITLFIIQRLLITFTRRDTIIEVKQRLVFFFITFMVVNRCLRCLFKIIKKIEKREVKVYKKAQKALKKK